MSREQRMKSIVHLALLHDLARSDRLRAVYWQQRETLRERLGWEEEIEKEWPPCDGGQTKTLVSPIIAQVGRRRKT